MASDFSRCLSLLRQERGVSQRAAAKDLGISQALLSHYENGVREPGLAFVVKACNYYHGVGGLSSGARPCPGRHHHRLLPTSCTITPRKRTMCSTAASWLR